MCRRRKPLAQLLLLDQGRWNEILIRASKYTITKSEEGTTPHNKRETKYVFKLLYKPIFRIVRHFLFKVTLKKICLIVRNIGLYNNSNTYLVYGLLCGVVPSSLCTIFFSAYLDHLSHPLALVSGTVHNTIDYKCRGSAALAMSRDIN